MPPASGGTTPAYSSGNMGRLVTFVIGSCLARFGAGAIPAGITSLNPGRNSSQRQLEQQEQLHR